MNHGQRWGWRAAAVKLLVAPVVAAGVVAGVAPPAQAQTKETPKAASAQPAGRNADPKELIKQGYEALKAGQLDRALDLAKQADANNASGRWGLFDDTPESLEKAVASARAKAGKVEAAKLAKAAKELYAKAAKTPGERLANLDQAYAMADRAATLAGPTDFFDDVFGGGDRPEKFKKEVDVARATLRKSNPGVVSMALAKPAATGVQQAAATGRPADGSRVKPVQATAMPAPVVPPPSTVTTLGGSKAEAGKLVADGRALLRAGRVVEAKGKAADAAKLNASFLATEDTPDLLTRDCLAEGKSKVDAMVTEAEARVAAKDYANAEARLTGASQLADTMGLSARPIDDRLVAVRKLSTTSVVVAHAAPIVVPPMPTPVATGGMSVPTMPAAVAPSVVAVVPAPAAPDAGMAIPTLPTVLANPPASVALAPAPVATPAVVTLAPTVPAVPGVLAGSELLQQARASLRSNDIEMARKLAVQAHNAGSKDEAQALLRDIDAESYSKQRKEAIASYTNAVGLVQIKQFDQALMAFKLIDADALTAEQKAGHADMVKQCEAEIAKLKAAATPVTVVAMQEPKVPAVPAAPAGPSNGVTTPVAPTQGALVPADAGLTGQVKALATAEFQKLRGEGLEAESKARDAYNRGDTDVAIQMLTDFTNKVRASKLTEGRQADLLQSVERRLQGFRVMKRQTDFYATEARTKDDNRSKAAGKLLAEQQKQDDIKRKVAEVNELSKKKQYRPAEELALQLKSLDPDDTSLNAIYELTKRQRRVADYAAIKGNKEQAVLDGLNSADNFGQVPTDAMPVVVDPVSAMKSRIRGDGNNLYAKPLSPAEREIEVRLERPITVEFSNNVTLRDAIASVRTKTGLNITTDDAALAEDPTALDKTLVNESLKDLSLRNVLTVLLDKASLKFVVENDVIRITTEKRARGKLMTKVFSVMELVTPIPDFALAPHQSLAKALGGGGPSPAWSDTGRGSSTYSPTGGMKTGELISNGPIPGVHPSNVGAAVLDNSQTPLASSATLAKTGRSNHSDQLMRLIKGMVKPYSWSDEGGAGKLQYFDIGGALVVNQTADVIADVQLLLESLRRLQEVSVSIEIRVMSLSESFFERIGVDFAMNIKTKQRGSQFEQSLTTGQFRPEPFINSIDTNNVTVGYNPAAGGFTSDLNFPVRTNSYGLGVPPFGGYPGPGNGGLGLGLAFLNDIQVFMFMEAAAGDRRVSTMQAPKVTLFNGQTASIFVGDVSFFTTGLDVINVGGQFVYIPRNTPIPIGIERPIGVQTQLPGVSIAVQAIVSSDRRFVRMNLTPTLSSLTSATVPLFPVTAFITPVFEGGSQGVPIPFTQFFQQPQISEINVQTTVSCPDGGTVVLGGLKTLSEGRNEFGPPVLSQIPYINRLFRNQGIGRETRHIMIMVTPRIIIQSEEELNQTGSVNGNVPGQ